MKLTFSPTSPFARKVRIAAIELHLNDRIELVPTTTSPGQAISEYSLVTPLKKLPVLITDEGDTILDSYVIVEYLNELANGSLIPANGARRWRVKSDHCLVNGLIDSMVLCRYEKTLRPPELQWQDWYDDHWTRVWNGLAWFERRSEALMNDPLDLAQIALVCMLDYVDFRFADCGWRQAYPGLSAFYRRMQERPSVTMTAPPPA
ncbi:MAG: glutathione S-transferase family protein [Alphaproteobacteria bacterium]|nr:glutathione S-transferase family protein [Alphaproteobacteria bacterium]